MFLQQARKQKLNIRIAKKPKHCILPCFWPVGCQNSRSEKCLKHRCVQCFVLPPKTKQRYVRCFPTLNTPKWSRNNGIYDVFATAKKVFLENAGKQKITWEWQKYKNAVFYDVFSLSGAKTSVLKSAQNIVIYNVFCSHQRQNNAIYDVFLLSQPQNRAETSVFTMFLQHQKNPG